MTTAGNLTIQTFQTATQNLNLFGDLVSSLTLVAVIAGIMIRTGGKAYDKWRDGEITKFEPKYIGMAFVAFISSIIIAMPLMPAATEVFTLWVGQWGVIIAMIMTGGWAYGVNEGVNYTAKRIFGAAEKSVIKSGKLDPIIEKKVAEALAKQQAG